MGWPSYFEKLNELKQEALALDKSPARPREIRDWLGTGIETRSLTVESNIRIEDLRSELKQIITIIDKLLEFATDPAMNSVEEIKRARRQRDRARLERDQAMRERDQAMRERDLLRAEAAQLRAKPTAATAELKKRRGDNSMLRKLRHLQANELALVTALESMKRRVAELESENTELESELDRIIERYRGEMERLSIAKIKEDRKMVEKVERKNQDAISGQQSLQKEFQSLLEEKERIR
jgi:hypothetical protein